MSTVETVKPFKLVKYFAYSSLFFLFLAFWGLVFIVSKEGKELILQKSKEYAFLVAENLNHQVYQLFTIPTYRIFGRIRLREKVQQERLDFVVRNTIHGFDIKEVNVYDPNQGIVAYSTNPKLIGKKVDLPPEFYLAKQGIIASRIEGTQLKTYAPFRAESIPPKTTKWVLGVFEIVQDLSKDYHTIRQFEISVAATALIIMVILFLILTSIVRRAEAILIKRAEERRRLEDRLRQTEQLATLGEMIATVSHEIKNPLGVISSTAELLNQRLQQDKINARLSGIIVDEVKRLNRILNEFLDFARPKLPQLVPCRLRAVIDKVLAFLSPELTSRQIQVIKSYKSDVMIKADPDLLYRAFLNIMINAIQAISQKGQIRIEVTELDDRVCLIFEDNGPGIKEDVLRKIFNPFFTTKEHGSGLGLPVVKRIVENHGGEVKIESKEGEGTKVIIYLPKG